MCPSIYQILSTKHFVAVFTIRNQTATRQQSSVKYRNYYKMRNLIYFLHVSLLVRVREELNIINGSPGEMVAGEISGKYRGKTDGESLLFHL